MYLCVEKGKKSWGAHSLNIFNWTFASSWENTTIGGNVVFIFAVID